MDAYEVGLAVTGLVALGAAWLPAYTDRRAVSLPIVLLVAGAAAFALPLGLNAPNVIADAQAIERVTEFTVIVSIMATGLKIDRPFGWRTWSNTWRMLVIAMPITIALTAVAGATIGGLSAVSALLLGAVLAPTDPVLAGDVQVEGPGGDEDPDPLAEEEVRFVLTSEGGLNDALAFPFVYLAIRLAATDGDRWNALAVWFGWDLVGRVVLGVLGGYAIGRVMAVVAFRPPGKAAALSDTPQGFVAVAATLLAYGGTELIGGYGFLAVFVTAVVLRGSEPGHAFHGELHGFLEQLENFSVAALLLLLGGTLVTGVFGDLSLGGFVVAALLVLVVRPTAALAALWRSRTPHVERATIAFFGIRGFGSVYYLAYALTEHPFAGARRIWAIVACALCLSIVLHGVAVTPVMELARRRARRGGRRATVDR